MWRAVDRGRDASSRDAGVTLVETLVSMVIFSVAMAVTTSVFIMITQQTRDNLGRADSVQNARMGMMQIDRMVRSGNLFYDPASSGGMQMLVFTQSNGLRHCAEWRVGSDGQLMTRSWSPTWQTDGDVSAWITTARHVVNQAPGYTPVPAFSLTSVGTNGQSVLNIRLLVKEDRDEGRPTELLTTVSGRNTLFGYDPAVCQVIPPI